MSNNDYSFSLNWRDKMNIAMGLGTRRMLDYVLTHNPDFEEILEERISEEMNGSSEEIINEDLEIVTIGAGSFSFFLQATIGDARIIAGYKNQNIHISDEAICITNIPESIRQKHKEKAEGGMKAQDIVDIAILEGISITEVLTKGYGKNDSLTVYLLGSEWRQRV